MKNYVSVIASDSRAQALERRDLQGFVVW